MITVLILLIAIASLPFAAEAGLLGEPARKWMTELTEEGKRHQIERRLHEADRASEADLTRARSAMNEAAGQRWRNLSEWRDE